MLTVTNSVVRHTRPVAPHHMTVPAKKDAMDAWEAIKKRIKHDENVSVLERYLLTR